MRHLGFEGRVPERKHLGRERPNVSLILWLNTKFCMLRVKPYKAEQEAELFQLLTQALRKH